MVAHIPEIVWNPAFVGMVLGLGPLVPILTFGIRAERRDLRFSEQLDSESLLLVA